MKKLVLFICVMLMTAVGAYSKDILKAQKSINVEKKIVPQKSKFKAKTLERQTKKHESNWGEKFGIKPLTKSLARPAKSDKTIAPLAGTKSPSIEAKESQMWWGYIHEHDIPEDEIEDYALGLGSATQLDLAIYVYEDEPYVQGSTIMAVRLWLNDVDKIKSKNLYLWIYKTKIEEEDGEESYDIWPEDVIEDTDLFQLVPVSSLVNGINDIELDEPFECDGTGLTIGYTFTPTAAAYPIVAGGADVEFGGFLIGAEGLAEDGGYGLFSLDDYGYGVLGVQLLLDGGEYPDDNYVGIDYSYQSVVLQGEGVKAPLLVYNLGKNTINDISYIVETVGGETSEELTVEVGPLAWDEYDYYAVSIPADENVGKTEKIITITKVNGEAAVGKYLSSNGYNITLDTEVPTMPVVEEFTGTWCQYCPYGIVGMEEAQEKYGDDIIQIAVHQGDPMETEGYKPILDGVGSYPSAFINRTISLHPFNLVSYLDYYEVPTWLAQGNITATATWANEEKTAIDISTATNFVYGESEGQYGIAYVLVENGLKGDGEDWEQANYFSGTPAEQFPEGYEGLLPWAEADEYVAGMTYDHVAVAAWGIGTGVEGSVSPAITANETQNYLFKADIAENNIIQDKSNVKVVALLLDNINGTIVNAVKVNITEGSVEPVYELGDVNKDGNVNSADVQKTYAFMAQGATGETNPEADVNGDGHVNSADIQKIYSIMATQK